jgi:hypothetical protein
MDYNIKVKAEGGGAGKSAGGGAVKGLDEIKGMRDQAVKASQKQQTPGTSVFQGQEQKKLTDATLKLFSGISKLIPGLSGLNTSIKAMEKSIKDNTKSKPSGAGGGGGGGSGTGGGDSSSGLGAVGSAAGYLGVPIAVAGFAIQKVNQIGNAYIEKVSQQKGTAGIAGMQWGREGAYLAPEVAEGVKAHRMASGSFKGEVDKSAFQVGTIYGESSQTIGEQSGTFARYGASYGDTVKQGLGYGIETDLPKLMAGVASEMEDAVKNGVNSSSLSTDIGEEVVSLTAHTQTKSVDMALNMINKFAGTKEAAAMGQVGGINELMSWRAGQDKMIEGLNDTSIAKGKKVSKKDETIKQWEDQGLITKEQGETLRGSQNLDMATLRDTVGQSGVAMLTKNTISGMGTAEALRSNITQWQGTFGSGPEGMAKAHALYSQNGGNMDTNQFSAAWMNARNPEMKDLKSGGDRILKKKYQETEGSAALLGVKKQAQMDNLIYERGAAFAESALAMQKAMIDVADTLAGKVIPILKKINKGEYKDFSDILPIKGNKASDNYDVKGGFSGSRG